MPLNRPAPPLDAEDVALKALAFLVSDMDRLGRFLATTGLGPDTIRRAANEPGFLAAVLDYLGSNESLLLMFATNAQLDPAKVAEARERLGRDSP